LRSASQNVLLVPRYKLSGLGRRAFRVAGPLVWNSNADCLRDPALELASFKRQLKTFLLFPLSAQRIERIRDAMTMRYRNLLFTYFTYYALKLHACEESFNCALFLGSLHLTQQLAPINGVLASECTTQKALYLDGCQLQ